MDPGTWLRRTELDSLGLAEMVEQIARSDAEGVPHEPRHYPGYPTWSLPRVRRRWWPGLDSILHRRRCVNRLGTTLPSARTLGQILGLAHGISGTTDRGPTPSAGGLQALELFAVTWQPGWLPRGSYHYDRHAHSLAQIVPEANGWPERVPSLRQITGGAVLWILVGETARVAARYGERGERFLLLEAGHLMQNLCLVSASLGLCTVPLGGFLESAIAHELRLPTSDRVLYIGVCGQPQK